MFKSLLPVLFIDLLFVILGSIGIYQIRMKQTLPLTLQMVEGELIVAETESRTLPAGKVSGIRLIAVGNKPVSTLEDVEFVCDGLKPGDNVGVTLLTNASLRSVRLRLVPFYGSMYIFLSILHTLLVLTVTVLVVFNRPRNDKVSISFHGMMISLFSITALTWGSYVLPNQTFGILTRIVFSAAYAFIPVFFFWFTFVFPKEKWKNAGRLIAAMSLFALVISTGMGYTIFTAVDTGSPKAFNVHEIWFDICRTFFAVTVLISVCNFGHSYKYAAEESERRKLRWIFLGALIGPLPFIFLWQLPQLFTSKGLIPEEFVLVFAASIPLTFGFSIVRYHTFDIDLLFKRSFVYGIMLLLIISLYALIVGGFTVVIGKITVLDSVLLSGIVSVIAAPLFQPMRDRVKRYVDRKFFIVQYTFGEAQTAISEKLDACHTPGDVLALIHAEVNKIIPVKEMQLIYSGFGTSADSTTAVAFPDKNLPDEIVSGIARLFTLPNGIMPRFAENTVERGVNYKTDFPEIFAQSQFCGMIPIAAPDGHIGGALFVGKKKSGFVFSIEDISLLTFSCGQAGAALHRIALMEKLRTEQLLSTKLRELSELKSFFVSSVSHELKTPLTSIKMFSELLQQTPPSQDKQLEYLRIIEGECDRLTRLINNVLDFAKIEKGIKEYRFREINLTALVRDVMRMMHYQLHMNAFSVHEEYSIEECPVRADEDAVMEACMNIIGNAIKYSNERKQLSVTLQLRQDEIVLSFEDSGTGIPESRLSSIFEPYVRVLSEVSMQAGGTGLGLAIVRHIMHAHGGRVEVRSALGEGSTFSLVFPRNYPLNADVTLNTV